MSLKLNEPQVYKEFYGKNIDQMPKLIAEGRTPLSVNGLMNRRLEVLKSDNAELKAAWIDNYFDTGDGCSRNTNGNLKVVYDAKKLRELNSESKLPNGDILLGDSDYRKLEGPEFKKAVLDKYAGRSLTKQEVLHNPLWLALAREDKSLLREYASKIFSEAKTRFSYNENMGLYLPSVQEKPIMRSWFVWGLDDGSDANGDYDLGVAGSRLVGVTPGAQVIAKNLEGKVKR